jgi:replicative DNA helicase
MRIIPKHIRDIAAGHAALRRVKREFGNDLAAVFVDYAQLVRGQGKSRYEQMTDVSIGLKTIAGMLECPVIALVQLDRNIGERENRRPQLSDIKETGQFENDADQVVFCHREEYWLERAGPKPGRDGKISADARADWEADLAAARNLMEIIVRKNRHGRLATATAGFHAPTNRFWTLEHQTPMEDF